MTSSKDLTAYNDRPLSALAEIRARCEEIDRSPEFAAHARASTLEERMLRKIDALETVLATHGVAMPLTKHGLIDRHRVRAAVRQIGARSTDVIAAAFEELDERHRRPPTLRHVPERQIDRDIDRYEILLADRDLGPPRSPHRLQSISVEGCAEEMECQPEDIDRLTYRRLNAIAAGMPPGAVHYGATSAMPRMRHRARVSNPAVAVLVRKAIAASNGVFPQDPLFTNRLDVISFASRAGVGVPDIVIDPSVHALVEAAATAKGAALREHPLVKGRRYTYAELIEWARDAERLPEPDDDGTIGAIEDDQPGDDGNVVKGAAENVAAVPTVDRVATRKQIHALREYIRRFAGPKGEQELVRLDFKEQLERTMRRRASEFQPGWRGLVLDWIGWNDNFRATRPIPDSFGLTIRLLCREVGLTLSQLVKGLGSVRVWADGMAIPKIGSELQFREMARRLRQPVALLKLTLSERHRKRSFDINNEMFPNATRHLPEDFETMPEDEQLAMLERNHWRHARQGMPFGRRHAYMKADEYALVTDRWTPAMVAAWEATRPDEAEYAKPFRKLGEASRRRDADGKLVKKEKPWREATGDFKQGLLVYYLGFLHRPRDIGDLAPMNCAAARLPSAQDGEHASDTKPEFVREGGLGIPTEYLTPAVLALNNLAVSWVWWKIRRSGQLVRTIPHTLKVLARMLKPETGIIWKSPDMLEDLEAFAKWWAENPHETVDGEITLDIEAFRHGNWQAAVRAAYDTMIEDITDLMDGDIKSSRDSFLSVGTFTEDEDVLPMVKYMVGVRTLLAARPHTILSRHKHVRDCVQTLILCQTGLRTYNMMFTFDDGAGMPKRRRLGRDGKVLQPTLVRSERDGKVRWTIDIPSGEFKNWFSPYFKDAPRYRFTLRNEDGLYALLETYITKARPYFLRGRKSDAFFVSSKNHDMDEGSLGTRYKVITGDYFVPNPEVREGGVEGAVQHAMHAVRHVIATHIVKKTGDLHLAAWAIQDTLLTVEKHYARFMPSDKANHADAVLAKARAVGRLLETDDDGEGERWLRAA
jgi:hypothetical protein